MPATTPLASANRSVAIGSREWLNQLVADFPDGFARHGSGPWTRLSCAEDAAPSAGSRNRGTLFDRPHEPLRMRV